MIFNMMMSIFCFFLSWPIFFDFSNFEFINQEGYWFEGVGIPMPIGALILMVFLSVFNLLNKKIVFIKNSSKLIISFFVLIPLSSYFYMVSGLSVSRIIQLVMPLLFFLVVAYPEKMKLRRALFFSWMLGFFLFSTFHMIYVVLNSNEFHMIDEFSYTLIFEHRLYQALVSYPGGMTIFYFLCISIAISGIRFPFKYTFCTLGGIVAIIQIGMAARRVSLFELTFGILIFSLLLIFNWKKIDLLSKKFVFIFFGILIPVHILIILNSPLFLRSTESVNEGEFDSGRLDIYREAFRYFSTNIDALLFGVGGEGHVGFHNYVLDTVHRVGVIGFLVLFITILLLSIKFLNFTTLKNKSMKIMALFPVFMCCLMQVTVNSAITQPYYLIFMLMSFFAINFVIFE